MALLTSASNHTASHPGFRRHIEPSNNNVIKWRLSSSSSPNNRVTGHHYQKRSRAERIGNMLGTKAVRPCRRLIPSRDSFPHDFIFGASTAAYQIEGAWNVCGKGPSVWDHFCHNYPERIEGGANGDHAVNSYCMYKEDVKMLKEMGMDAYRFSISWSRILPRGTVQGGINHKGIEYYRNLIDTLKENGIEPYVTIFHWDTPQALQDMYGGFLDRRIVHHYRDFAGVCFKYFGDKVKHWFTFNEPYIFSCFSFGTGQHAPGRYSPGKDCPVPYGDSLTEPYIVGHHLLLAHAEAADLYKKHYQGEDGHIGLALVSTGYVPYDPASFLDQQAKERCIDYNLAWFLEPVFRGDYPFSMRSLVGDRLPYFTDDEQKKLVGSYNMMGLNYYYYMFTKNIDISPKSLPKLNTDDAYAEFTSKLKRKQLY